ncbi:MAG: AAA family ATPase [Lachnospiraceae bacterium]|nr:AAA family ATPase [Lachnospiraceae bacterium]
MDFIKTIILSGVHGVGKGYFLERIQKEYPRLNILQASKLIEKYKNSTDAGYKKVKSVMDNQIVLIAAIEAERNNCQGTIVLDGHLCVINSENEVKRIPESFFLEGNISGVILLQDEPAKVEERLKKRDGKSLSKKYIEDMQKEETIFAESMEKELGIKKKIISHNCGAIEFMEIIDTFGGGNSEY